ncbi:MAG: TrmH family RNA methyltransferase [Suilimivivens sp.]
MISSTANSRVKRVTLLREKSRERTAENVFIVEGIKMFEEAPTGKIKEVYYMEEKLFGQDGQGITDRFPGLKEKIRDCARAGAVVETVTEEVLLKMSDTKSPQGILCVMEQLSYDSGELVEKAIARQKEGHSPLFLLLEDIQDPGNLGTMIRTAEGAGADGIFMTSGTVDIYNPKTIRATMGSLYRVPFVRVQDLSGITSLLQKNGITVYAAHLKGEKYYHETDYSGGSAFLIGNEGNGLKKETADLADCYLKIPMEGKLESLNAAIAAALLMYQSRQ